MTMTEQLKLVHLMGYVTISLVLATATWAPPWAPVVVAPVALFGLAESVEQYRSNDPTASPDLSPSGDADQAPATAGGDA